MSYYIHIIHQKLRLGDIIVMVRVNSDELHEALNRVNSDYIYFRPKIAAEKLRRQSSLTESVQNLVLIVRSSINDRQQDDYAAYEFMADLQMEPSLRKHVENIDLVTDSEWTLLLDHGYFTDKNPEMKLFKHDAGLFRWYRCQNIERYKLLLKMNKATNRLRDQNRKVGKRIK